MARFDVGLIGVEPSLQGSGVGLRLLEEASTSFRILALTCRRAVLRVGRVEGASPPGDSHEINNDLQPEIYTGPGMALPVLASLSGWPLGDAVVRDVLEVWAFRMRFLCDTGTPVRCTR